VAYAIMVFIDSSGFDRGWNDTRIRPIKSPAA
jgi:hypothetical protein